MSMGKRESVWWCVCVRESVSERVSMCSRVYLIYNIKSVYVSMSEKSCRKQGRDFDMTRAMMLTAVWDISNNLQILTSLGWGSLSGKCWERSTGRLSSGFPWSFCVPSHNRLKYKKIITKNNFIKNSWKDFSIPQCIAIHNTSLIPKHAERTVKTCLAKCDINFCFTYES